LINRGTAKIAATMVSWAAAAAGADAAAGKEDQAEGHQDAEAEKEDQEGARPPSSSWQQTFWLSS
jgi:ribosomal protein L12E/L44/L45/RPP1/RPP2